MLCDVKVAIIIVDKAEKVTICSSVKDVDGFVNKYLKNFNGEKKDYNEIIFSSNYNNLFTSNVKISDFNKVSKHNIEEYRKIRNEINETQQVHPSLQENIDLDDERGLKSEDTRNNCYGNEKANMTMTMSKLNAPMDNKQIFQSINNNNCYNTLESYMNNNMFQNKIFNNINQNQINFNGGNMYNNEQQSMMNLLSILQTSCHTNSNTNSNSNSYANNNTINHNLINNINYLNNLSNDHNERANLQLHQPFNVYTNLNANFNNNPNPYNNDNYQNINNYNNATSSLNYQNQSNELLQSKVLKVLPKNNEVGYGFQNINSNIPQ